MEFLTRLLDDPAAGPCGQCDNDRGGGLSHEVDPELVVEARTFFRRDLRPIAPRKKWMSEAGETPSGNIKPPNEPGLALSVLGDAGWGRLVSARTGERGVRWRARRRRRRGRSPGTGAPTRRRPG